MRCGKARIIRLVGAPTVKYVEDIPAALRFTLIICAAILTYTTPNLKRPFVV